MKNPFDFFNKIYCINLDRRSDRWEKVSKEFESIEIYGRVERFSAFELDIFEDKKRNACYGNHTSHAKCIKNAFSKGFNNVLIFEDDVMFLEKTIETLSGATLQLPLNWDLLYLGVNIERPAYQVNKNLARLTFAYSTHAYAVNLKNVNLFMKLWEINSDIGTIHNDVSYNELIIPNFNCLSCVPIIAIQQPSYSDIEEKFVSYDWMVDRFNSNLVLNDDVED